MNYNKKIVLIPAYEPTLNMINLLKELKKNNFEIIVVDDGSGISFKNIFNKAKKYATVLTHEINKGKGRALKTGLNYIKNNMDSNYIVVTMDCDGQHKVSDAIKLCEYCSNNSKKLILGKRLRNKKIPLRSKLGNSITRIVYKFLTGLDVYDTQTGLRAFSDKLIPFMLKTKGDRFEYEMNVLLKCPKSKIEIDEVEIETIYIENNSHSHFNTLKDSVLIYKEIFKFLISSLCCFIIDYSLYSILILTTNNLVISNIMARIISATINFNINKSKVFKSNGKYVKQACSYFVLALVILILNTTILSVFVNYFTINQYIAKLLTEIILLFFSWTIQKKIIFKR